MKDYRRHLIPRTATVRNALAQLNELGFDAILIITGEGDVLVGSLTDGDIRRGFLKGHDFDTPLDDFIQKNATFIYRDQYTLEQLEDYRRRNLKVIPILNEERKVVDVLNLRIHTTLLPLDAVVMAGGEGKRLRPLTEHTPKPLLKVAGKPIIQHNVDRLMAFGVSKFYITVKYLAEQLVEHFTPQNNGDATFAFVQEDEPLGTIGALSMIADFEHDHVLVMNSDLLTDIDFADLYRTLLHEEGDMIVATAPYEVNVPYGVIETDGARISGLKEKPVYTYYSNAGIYILKRAALDLLPRGKHFNATDLIEALIADGRRVLHYPILGYWLDIGGHEAYEKAQRDVHHLHL